jgi:NADP-dependent 3-hydroxy acid dehydrogenase YdfG
MIHENVDAIVNNAGSFLSKPLTTQEDYESVYKVNVLLPVLTQLSALPAKKVVMWLPVQWEGFKVV